MRLCRFGEGRIGIVEESGVRDVTAALEVLPPFRYPFPPYDALIDNLDGFLDRARTISSNSPLLPMTDLRLLSPVANPSKIVGAPVNYQKHLHEVRTDAQLHHDNQSHTAVIQKIGLFLKASSALAGPADGIALRKLDRRNDHEVEL